MEEKEFGIITLEDNLDYAEIDKINYNKFFGGLYYGRQNSRFSH